MVVWPHLLGGCVSCPPPLSHIHSLSPSLSSELKLVFPSHGSLSPKSEWSKTLGDRGHSWLDGEALDEDGGSQPGLATSAQQALGRSPILCLCLFCLLSSVGFWPFLL